MLKDRVVAAALGLPALIVLLWLNWFLRTRGVPDNLPVLAIVLLIAGASGWELSRIVRHRYPHTANLNGLYAAIILPLLVHSVVMAGLGPQNTPAPGIGLLLDSLGATAAVMLLFLAVWSDIEQRGREGLLENVWVLAGGLYLGVTLSTLLLLQATPFHEAAVGFTFTLVFTLDTAAYFGGTRLGGKRLAPSISPHKTYTGALSGLLAVVVAAVLIKLLPTVAGFSQPPLPWWNIGARFDWPQLLLLSVAVSVVGQVGDLLESALKRWGGVKDAGTILPGHGGFLDRFDSLLLVAPCCYLLMHFFLHL